MIKFSEHQKKVLIRLLKDLASIDHNLTLTEATRLRLVGLKLDLHEDHINETMAEDFEPIKNHLEAFETDAQKRFVYQQAMLLLLTDRVLEEEEETAATEMRQAFQLDDTYHQQVVEWVNEGLDWEKRGMELAGGQVSG